MFVTPASAFKLSDSDNSYLRTPLLRMALLNGEPGMCQVVISTGSQDSPVIDTDRTNQAIKICQNLTDRNKFACVWWTEKMFPGGEHFFAENLKLDFKVDGRATRIVFHPNPDIDYIPLDVLKLLKEEDIFIVKATKRRESKQNETVSLHCRYNRIKNLPAIEIKFWKNRHQICSKIESY